MKFPALKFVFALCLSFFSTTSIAATLFNRADFGANAVEFGFDGIPSDTESFVEGNLEVEGGGFVLLTGPNTTDIVGEAYANVNSTGSSSTTEMTFNFLEPITAFGFDFFTTLTEISLELFDINDNLLEAITFNPQTQPCPPPNDPEASCGFIGLNAGNNLVNEAIFKFAGLTQFPPVTVGDNIIYQVPTPGILWLLSTGFLGLYWSRKQNLS
jgi:hypothetical protein